MVGEAEASGSEFGIVCTVARGEESALASTGCTVTVDSVVTRYPDGRFDVITRGQRRFRIVSLDDEKPYLRGTVEYFDDEEPGSIPAELLNRALEAHERLRQEIGETEKPVPEERDNLSFRLAEGIDDLDFRSMMLQPQSESERLRMFAKFVAEYIPRHQYVAHMKKTAPTNGSGHKGPKIG
jgi:Lon protease-like protein